MAEHISQILIFFQLVVKVVFGSFCFHQAVGTRLFTFAYSGYSVKQNTEAYIVIVLIWFLFQGPPCSLLKMLSLTLNFCLLSLQGSKPRTPV